MTFSRTYFVVALLIAIFPLFAHAQSNFSRQGIFGCSRNAAALSNSVGAFSATGGVYVPVADYTVELNTGTLVYQQCVLRGIVNREAESANTALIKQEMSFILTGKDGNAMFRVNTRAETLVAGDRIALRNLQTLQTSGDSLSQAMGGTLVSTVAKNYTGSRQPVKQLQCPYDIDINNCFAGNDTSDTCINAMADTRCSKRFAPIYYTSYLYGDIARENADIDQQLEWGRGFYPKTRVNDDGDLVIDTPSVLVEEIATQALTSGFRRIENANDIDQMIGALYAGLGTQVLTGSGGLLTGLTTAIGSGASYLSQMTAESSAGLRNAAANAALQTLAGWRAIEVQYNQVVRAIVNAFEQAKAQLRSVEKQCWDLIAYNDIQGAGHVCTAPPTGNTCTGVSGATLHIATSTQFSDAVIAASITPNQSPVVANLQKSQQALQQIDQLIQGVSNTNSLDAQRLALVQLDQLVTNGQIHRQSDVTAVQQLQGSVNDSMTQLVEQTKTLWADNSNFDIATGSGWCNVKNPAVISYWDQQWR